MVSGIRYDLGSHVLASWAEVWPSLGCYCRVTHLQIYWRDYVYHVGSVVGADEAAGCGRVVGMQVNKYDQCAMLPVFRGSWSRMGLRYQRPVFQKA